MTTLFCGVGLASPGYNGTFGSCCTMNDLWYFGPEARGGYRKITVAYITDPELYQVTTTTTTQPTAQQLTLFSLFSALRCSGPPPAPALPCRHLTRQALCPLLRQLRRS